MKTVKTVLKYLKQMGIEVDTKLILGLIGLAILVGGFALFMWKKRRDKKAVAQEDIAWDESPAPVAKAPEAVRLKASSIIKDWKGFLSGLPRVLRRSVYQFTPIIVLGDTGSGKSSLVDTFSDWKRQARQYPGAVFNGENLDVYLGTQTLTIEIPGRVLSMPTQMVRQALIRAFRPILNRADPVVVIALSLNTLRNQSPDYLRELAESIRGKLDVLSSIRRQPLTIRLAITSTDSIEGFGAWSSLSSSSQIASQVNLDADNLDDTLTRISGIQDYLPLALTSLSAQDYLEFVSFTQNLPKELARLGDFLESLFAANPMSEPPQGDGVYFCAMNHKLPGGNPLSCAQRLDSSFSPLRIHKLAAAAIALTMVLGTFGIYQHERDAWEVAKNAVDQYVPTAHRATEQELREKIIRYTDVDKRRIASLIGFGFYDEGREQIREQFIKTLQSDLLLPEIAKAGSGLSPLGRSIYLLGILYSTQDNDFGPLIGSRLADWEQVTGIPADIIESYVGRNTELYAGALEVNLPENLSFSPVYELAPWIAFIRSSEVLMQRVPMDTAGLTQLKKHAQELQGYLEKVRHQSAALPIYDLLVQSIGSGATQSLGVYAQHLEVTRSIDKMSGGLQELISTVLHTDLAQNQEPIVSLIELASALGIAIETQEQEKRVLGFDFGTGQTWVIKLAEWQAVVQKSRLRKMVSAFLNCDRLGRHDSFFPEGKSTAFNPVLMNPYGKPVAEFTGDAMLDGIFTRSAFNTEVVRSVQQVSDLLAMLAFDADLASSLKLFVQRKVYEYAEDYSQQLADFYSDFSIQARSTEAIQIVLSQMLDPVSPFQDFLRAVEGNASFTFPENTNDILAPMINLNEVYKPLIGVLAETEDGGDLKRYKAILAQLRQGLNVNPPTEEELAEGETAVSNPEQGLRDLLSPAGKISLDILRGTVGNYLKLVDDWVASVELSPELAKPFREPILLLYNVGLRNIEKNVNDQWARKIALPMETHLAKFPFNRAAKAEINAEELTAFFHPVRGLFNQQFTRIFEPVLVKDRGIYRVRRSNLGKPRIHDDILSSINRVARMSRRLWDTEGNPRALEVIVTPKLFGSMVQDKQALTLVYLSSGKTSLFNFNQKPALKGLKLDWTHQTTAQVGIQLTNRTTGEHRYPGAVIAQDSHWSFFRLLTKGSSKDLSWSWSFGDTEQGKEVKIPVTFELKEDPWELFTIPNATRLSGL